MRPIRLLVLAATATLLIPHASFAAGAARGSAASTNTLVRLSAGPVSASLGVDHALSSLDGGQAASAGLDVLSVGGDSFGRTDWDYETKGSGSSDVAVGTVTIPGIASVVVTGGAVGASATAEEASSSASAVLGGIDAADGVVSVAAGQTSAATSVGAAEARSVRTLSLGSVEVLSLRALLRLLAVDPGTLDCGGIEAAGLALSAATAGTCAAAAEVAAAATDAQANLQSAGAPLSADLASASSTVAGITLITPALLTLGASYGIDLQGLVVGAGDRNALIAEISRRLDAVGDAVAGASAGSCSSVGDAITGVVAAVPSLNVSLGPIADALAAACASLQSLLDALLDTSLLSIDTMDLSLTAVAGAVPSADADGAFGAIRVGNVTVALAGLAATSDTVESVAAAAATQSATALNALGIGIFAPQIDFLTVTRSAATAADGSSDAAAGITAIHVSIPPVVLGVPSGSGVGTLLARRPSFGTAAGAGASSPQIDLDIAVFDGDAHFTPASAAPGGGGGLLGSGGGTNGGGTNGGGTNGGAGSPGGAPLATTGSAVDGVLLLAMVCLLAGWRLRRASAS